MHAPPRTQTGTRDRFRRRGGGPEALTADGGPSYPVIVYPHGYTKVVANVLLLPTALAADGGAIGMRGILDPYQTIGSIKAVGQRQVLSFNPLSK